ncbi:MAG TPA: pyridoxal phosphate-dependent aminotransferase [Vicinamibacterales bacterium]|nr:pyridoxal phosphate-dependent aminotransferase [Vicinamibacterales bacterium]
MTQSLKIRSRMDAIQAPIVAVVGDWIRQTPGTISLGQGVVHYGPPREALIAVQEALADPVTHEYNDGAGVPPLVDALAAKLRTENGIDVARGSRVMVTAGANMAFVHAVFAVTEPGDEIILPVPFYFNHEMAIEMAGCKAVRVATDDRYQLRLDAIARAITPRTRAVVSVSPNNPSGAVFGEPSLRALSELCRERGLYHFADEVYEYFTYDGVRHFSPASIPGAETYTVSMYSLSKAYGFAGWRLGYMAYPEHLAAAMMKSQDTILVCATVASQVAALAALEVGRAYSAPYVRELADVREIVRRELLSLAPLVTVPPADGAFYVLLNVNADRTGRLTDMAIAERLVREYRVAVVPGTAFGMTDGCYFRVAYGALQKATVAEGIGRLAKGLRAILA